MLTSQTGCTGGPSGSTGAPSPPGTARGAVQIVASGLRIPWGVAFLPDGTALVTERGNIAPDQRSVTTATPAAIPRILSVSPAGRVAQVQPMPEVSTLFGEGGLLGIAVSPHYASDGWVYVYYSTATDNRIARLHLGQRPQPILTGIPVDTSSPARFHLGGRLAFGPDGMLYASTGETYVARTIAQDPASLGGKILRITPEGRPAPGNPFPNSPVYSLGHRNVQGLAWDSRGRLFATEFGEDRFDELNLILPGHNYGWPIVEGTGSDPRFDNPIVTWQVADASPSGLAIVNDRAYVACLRGQRLYRLRLDGTGMEQLLVHRYGRLRTVTPAPDGTLWITTSNRDGRAAAPDGPGQPSPDDDRILRLRL